MNGWQLATSILAGMIIVSALWGWLEERRYRRKYRWCGCVVCRGYQWPAETDGVEFPAWVNDRDWDLAAKLELYEADQ